MAIDERELAPGMSLIAECQGVTYHATVVRGLVEQVDGRTIYVAVTEDSESNTLGFQLDDGRGFKSLSEAGSAIMDGKPCDAAEFWSVAEEHEELVPEGSECPQCGERRMDWLVWRHDDVVQCATCGRVYEP
ncbi:MAG: hypothetical protein ABIH46_06525 [Chloroflexota bacterium]